MTELRLVIPDASIEHEDMCHFCGDGGELLQCAYCPAAYCYAISSGAGSHAADGEICIELARNTELNRFVFECPACYSVSKSTSVPPYSILRSVRRVRRVAAGKGQPALALVIFHLPANAASAGVLSERIVGQLEALEIEVTVILQLIPNIDLTYIGKMMEAVSPVFKIWCILFTESDPRGGWWIDSGSNAGRAGPEEILPHLLDQALEGWAEKSLAAHVVIVSCGLNLQNPEERQKIIGALSKSKWDALIAPSAPAVYSPDFTALLPDLLAQILFIQFDLEPALMRCWLKMPRVRDHTDLFVFSRPSREEEVKGSIWIHSPSWRRPWGIELPAVCCVCSCASSLGKASGWIKRYMRPASSFGEAYYFFSTSCCQYELHLAIFTGPLKLLERHGTQVVIAPLDANGERQFNYAEMCTIKRFPPTAQDKRVQHDNPWTPAGIERKRRMDEKSEAGERT